MADGARGAHHALLGDGGDQATGAVVDAGPGTAPPALRGGGVLDEQQPVPGVDVPVEPLGVVERGQAHPLAPPAQALAAQHRLQHHLVAHVGQQRTVHHLRGLSGDPPARPQPQVLDPAASGGWTQVEVALHMAYVEGSRATQELGYRMVHAAEDLDAAGQRLGLGHLWGVQLDLGTLLLLLEGGDHGEDRDPVLGRRRATL